MTDDESSGDTPRKTSTDGTCGAHTGNMCTNSKFGDCCSPHGYCGSTDGFCSPKAGCQLEYGTCVLDSAAGISPSFDGTCSDGHTCTGSTFGTCCSAAGFCGSTSAYCSPASGCQPEFGICQAALVPSKDGSCGIGETCTGSAFGKCCSTAGFCGSSPAYCSPENACQPTFGICVDPSPALVPSKDGNCGNGIGCKGAGFGDCCSQHGYCGSTAPYCGASNGCQPQFGTCQ